MKRVADYIFDYLADAGTKHVFLLTGGGAMFLNDALGRCSRLRYICCHHEQACTMAAEAYARVSGQVGVVSVTTGPGGINALNGVFGAFADSIPMLVISGQVKLETCLASYQLPHLRQLGDQEVDIVRMVKGITKYAVLVTDPKTIRYNLEKALYLAKSGRPGPCWLDIPVDVQSAMIDPASLNGYDPAEDRTPTDRDALARICRDIVARIKNARRPVVMPGSGVHLAGALENFETVIGKLGVPVVTAWTAPDVIASDDRLFCGRASSIGDRAGNFSVQNADLLLVLGSRLNIRQISYNWKDFARNAYKIQVDVDPAELDKPTVKPDMPVLADLRDFLPELSRQIDAAGIDGRAHADWLAWCRKRVARYPVVTEKQRAAGVPISPYHFLDVLIRKLTPEDIIVCGDGTASVVPYQVAHLKRGTRMFANSGSASMGYDIPASIGAAVAGAGRRVICFAGDGSGHMNIQELQTIKHHQFPIKIFLLNNGGYLSMRLTQGGFFKGNFIGESPRSGISFPDYVKVATAYGLPASRIEAADFGAQLDEFLAAPGPALCEVILDPVQGFEPRLSSRQLPDGRIVTAPFEDMAPFLSREELAENMIEPAK
ncbi:MAG TPA: thiamine pyrophosphate-binding protein [Candidatus Baltobacteraceae bacterium]|jgi:acetolactate synthase-1/2/3 large subunit|nr:thiamine pyrophosphate-binding protein [Candidatus Baltobacteraceae bacterium]